MTSIRRNAARVLYILATLVVPSRMTRSRTWAMSSGHLLQDGAARASTVLRRIADGEMMVRIDVTGSADRDLGHSMSVLEKRMLLQHFMQHYEMPTNSLLVWRKIVDWTDTNSLLLYCGQGLRVKRR